MPASKLASSSAPARKLHELTRLGRRRSFGNVAFAPSTVSECRQERIAPAQLPPVWAIVALTESYEGRCVPSARMSPACQRSRLGSSWKPKKRTESIDASQVAYRSNAAYIAAWVASSVG